MELNTTRIEGPAAPSASVVLLRDAGDDLEVFLLRRHAQSDVLGGAYVFPGGKVDPEDREWADRLDRPPEQLHALLGEPELAPDDAAGLFVTAIRELFEEAGVLLADVTPEQARAVWQALRQGPRFDELLAPSGVRLAASALQPWSRWITPALSSVTRKRFDTRFFVATVPPGQDARHDDHEATESLWLAPRAALRQYWDGAIDLAPPQILGLSHLARHRSVASVLAAAAGSAPPCIRPEPRDADGVRVLCYPGDPWHSEPRRALPGPTRLTWRNRRFEPDAGLAALLGD
ncbi:NUDIX domain-containing protein [Ramlibacter ginsenosidimutans]|uniref:NUDIX domain-containing protein n=1 Tax=Ramlibacter ginsenosidimutans TaxID=502333 RepID=A0A934TV01_9BURK|nr:NUDIX domain-containing protein [Ramlibacter ginsenosidimutans]MBK6008114.1 NUDIX domain-containing protein [Ramlibacter ginsenosidimutans]